MKRLIALALICASPALAETKAEKEARCTAQADIVAQTVTLRSEGKRERRAGKILTGDESTIDPKYAPAIPMLLAWVYELDKDQLTDEAATRFKEACLAFDQ